MAYELFCTDTPPAAKRIPEHHRVVRVDSESIGVAINAACRLIDALDANGCHHASRPAVYGV